MNSKQKKSPLGKYVEYLGECVDTDLEKMVLRFLPKGKDVKYLDVGCFDGVKTLKRANCIGTPNVIGIDLPTPGAKVAVQHGLRVVYSDLDEKWPLASKSVDCVTATEVIEHLADIDNFFDEIKRVLKTNGKLLITTDNLAGYHNIIALIFGNQPYTGPYLSKKYPIGHRPNAKYYNNQQINSMRPHLNVMTAKALKQLLIYNNFNIVFQGGAGMYPLPPFLGRLAALIDRNHASHCFFCAELSY